MTAGRDHTSAHDFASARAAILAAKAPEDLFGALEPMEHIRTLGAIFRRLVVFVHPDRQGVDKRAQEHATEAFERLNQLRAQALAKVGAGTYGDRSVAAPAAAAPPPAPVTIRSGKTTFVVGAAIAKGDVCDLYRCEADGQPAVVKIAQHASVNDLVENEATTLRAVTSAPPKEQEKLLKLFPELRASFMLAGKPAARRVNVLPLFDEHVSLVTVKRAYPSGLDFRDAVWMFKRALMAIGFAHRRGYVHGAVLPPHLLVHPIEHGAKLIDWSYAVPLGGTIKAISADHRGFYPSEVLAKQPATSATDIYMLARCMVSILGVGTRADIPRQLTAFLQGCTLAKPGHRPQDAWSLHEELDAILRRLVGPPQYRKLVMPAHAGGK